MPLTMKDIAAMLGVSESTVSRAISGKPGVSEKLREQILHLVEKHQFQPNPLAQGLASKETHTLGLILPDITHPHLTKIVQGVEARASQLGYHLILANTGGSRLKELSYLTLFKQHRVDGIIFAGGSLAEEEILKLGLNNSPLVLINKLLEELALPSLLIDHRQGGILATQHLLQAGHKQIGLVIGPLDDLTNLELYAGYCESLAESGFKCESSLVAEVEDSRFGGYTGLLRLLDTEYPPTAVFAAGDILAVGVVEAIKFGGYFIPEDVAVVGYGDTILTQMIDPPLTTVKLPLEELGYGAVDQLVKVIKKQPIEEVFVVLSPELIKRRSA